MLINKTDIGKYREVSRSVRDDKINPFIDDSEFLDVRPLLGSKLFRAISKNPENFTELLEGGEYNHKENTYDNPGLKKVICLFAYARYIMFGSFTDTAFGFVQKSGQDSQSVPEASKRNIHTKDRDAAMQYWFEVERYLNRKSDDYSAWRSGGCSPKTFKNGIRISKITR